MRMEVLNPYELNAAAVLTHSVGEPENPWLAGLRLGEIQLGELSQVGNTGVCWSELERDSKDIMSRRVHERKNTGKNMAITDLLCCRRCYFDQGCRF